MKMTIDQNGINMIKGFEGLKLTAYQDVAGVWTIGWGSTQYANGSRVKQGDKLVNRECADDLFERTLKPYEDAVNAFVKEPLTQGQYNALVDFAYNEGTGALERSTLLKELNAGNYKAAADQFLVWDEITDPETKKRIVNDDLAKRRQKERAIFLGEPRRVLSLESSQNQEPGIKSQEKLKADSLKQKANCQC